MSSDAKPYHHGDLANALLKAARMLLEEGGIESLSLRGITRRAGVSATAAVPHFGSLVGLRAALAAQGYDELADALLSAQGLPLSVSENSSDSGMHEDHTKARSAGRAYLAFATANPDLYRLMFRSALLDYNRPELARASARAFEALSLLCGDDGSGVRNSARMAGLWGRVHGLATLAIDGMLGPLLEEAEAPSQELFLNEALALSGSRNHE